MSINENSALQVLDFYKAAVYEKDANKFLSIYDSSARVFDTWGVWVFESRESRRSVIENWFESLNQERVLVNFSDIKLTESDELAVLTTIGSYAAISIDGVELRSMQNRFTWALKLIDSQWKIVHEHTSVPIGNDLTAILVRE